MKRNRNWPETPIPLTLKDGPTVKCLTSLIAVSLLPINKWSRTAWTISIQTSKGVSMSGNALIESKHAEIG